MDVPLRRAELIVALDYPRWVSLVRLLRRSVRRVVRRELVCNGNRETLPKLLGRDSIVRWHFQSFARKRARIRAWAAHSPGPEVIRLSSPRAAGRWLSALAPPPPR